MIAAISFFNYWALGFLVLVPILILLYFLKLRRPRFKVASTLLWQKVIEDMRVNSPFQRLRRSLLLLLQLILLLLLIFSLARPWFKSLANDKESFVVMLDISASMQAKEPGGKTRLELAKDRIREQIEHLQHKNEMMLLTFDSRAKTVCSFTKNKKKLEAALKAVHATDCATDISNALRIASSLARTRQKNEPQAKTRGKARLLLYSDGGFPDPGKVELPQKIEFVPIGTNLPNLAVTQMNVRRSVQDQDRIDLFVSVRNYSTQKFDGEMKVMLNDTLLDSKYFELAAGKSSSQVFQARMKGSGVLKVDFDVDDALKVDNSAVQVVQPPRKRRVLLVSNNPFYIRRALLAVKNVDVTSIAPEEFPDFVGEKFTTVVWSGVAKPSIAPTDNIYFGCFPEIKGLEVGEEIQSPDIAEWHNTHRVNRFIDYGNLLIGTARSVKFPSGSSILLRSSHHPLIGVTEYEGNQLIISTFNIYKSSWPFQVTLLYFMRNCLEFFDEFRMVTADTNIPVGGVIATPEQGKAPQILTPAGKMAPMTSVAGKRFIFNGLDKVGVYTVKYAQDEDDQLYAVNLFSRTESELKPETNPISDEKQLSIVEGKQDVAKEYFRLLLVIAIVVLAVEWLVYHRRILS